MERIAGTLPAAEGDERRHHDRGRRGDDLFADSCPEKTDEERHPHEPRRPPFERVVGHGEAPDGGDEGGDVLHKRGRQQSETRECGDERRTEHRRRRGQAPCEDPVREEQPDEGEHAHGDLLGPDPPVQRAEHNDLADQRAAVPAEEVDLPSPGEYLRDLAVRPGVVVGNADAAGPDGEGDRNTDADHEHGQEGGPVADASADGRGLRLKTDWRGTFGQQARR